MLVYVGFLCRAAALYGGLETLDGIYRVPALVLDGVELEPVMEAPFQSPRLRDFWGGRWDRALQMMLRDSVFTPLKRWAPPPFNRTKFAIFATFIGSGLLHCYGLVLMGERELYPLCQMLVFFLLQPFCIAIDDAFGGRACWLLLFSTGMLFWAPVARLDLTVLVTRSLRKGQ